MRSKYSQTSSSLIRSMSRAVIRCTRAVIALSVGLRGSGNGNMDLEKHKNKIIAQNTEKENLKEQVQLKEDVVPLETIGVFLPQPDIEWIVEILKNCFNRLQVQRFDFIQRQFVSETGEYKAKRVQIDKVSLGTALLGNAFDSLEKFASELQHCDYQIRGIETERALEDEALIWQSDVVKFDGQVVGEMASVGQNDQKGQHRFKETLQCGHGKADDESAWRRAEKLESVTVIVEDVLQNLTLFEVHQSVRAPVGTTPEASILSGHEIDGIVADVIEVGPVEHVEEQIVIADDLAQTTEGRVQSVQ